MSYSSGDIRGWLLHNHPKHDRCCGGQCVPVQHDEECVWIRTNRRSCERHFFVMRYPREGTYQVKIYCVWLFLKLTSAGRPIGMPLASLSYALSKSGSVQPLSARSPNSFGFSEQWKRTHGLFDPDGLTPRHVGHLVNIWKVKLPLLRLVIWCEHVLLPWLPQ